MEKRRQAVRRAPIEVEVRERVLEARPLPWLKRNELGNEIMSQYSGILNSALSTYTQTPEVDADGNELPREAPRLEIYLNDKIRDPGKVVEMGYPSYHKDDEDRAFFEELEYPEMLELIYASLEANELESLIELVDPNFLAPMKPGGTDSSGVEDLSDTPRTQSSPDSSLLESTEPIS